MKEPVEHAGALPRLILVTHRGRTAGRPLVPLLAEAARGGLRFVVLRERDLPEEELLELAADAAAVMPAGVVLSVSANPRVARAQGIGLHLPAAMEIPAEEAGDYHPLGRSVHSEYETVAALADRPDYLLVGSVFPTHSHPGRAASGPELLARIRAASGATPLYAIGGVTPARAPALLAAGAHGIAVTGAILEAADVAAATRELLWALGEKN